MKNIFFEPKFGVKNTNTAVVGVLVVDNNRNKRGIFRGNSEYFSMLFSVNNVI